MQLIFVNSSTIKTPRNQKKDFEKALRILKSLRLRNKSSLLKKKELTVVTLNPNEMRRINYQYRQKDKPTDVLSFQAIEPQSLGEILLCPAVLKRQAKEAGHTLQTEINLMFIHGVLHLLGYDHELSKAEEKLMFRLQDKAFQTLNRVYVNRS